MFGSLALIDAFAAAKPIFNGIDLMGLFFLPLMPVEFFWDRRRGKRSSARQSLANGAIFVGGLLLEKAGVGLVFLLGLSLFEPFALFDLSQFTLRHPWLHWALALLAADFCYYWMHRWEHEVRFLWATHSVHHSSPEFNLTTSLRLAWGEALLEWVFLVPMVLLGFGVVKTVVSFAIVVAYQTWIHTEKIGKLGWLDKVFNTPSVHRVHHGSNPRYLDKNYGGILMVWDQLFGTYQAEEEPLVYGLTEPLISNNPFRIIFHEWGKILADLRRARGLGEALHMVFGHPGEQRRPGECAAITTDAVNDQDFLPESSRSL